MEKRLYDASVMGSVESLKQVLVEDPLALARAAAVTWFDETPLHVAAMLGHLDLVKFIVAMLKPDMTVTADSQGRSPLHLAAANGYVEMVDVLVSANPNACHLRDGDGRTPLHLAVMKGAQADVITKLVQSQPELVWYRAGQGESLLHLAVKQNRLGALQLIFQLGIYDDDLVNAKDDHGNTILHTAASLKQIETIKYLLFERSGSAKVNAVNGNGLTALDMIEYMPRDLKQMEIRECLVNAGALRARKISASAPEDQLQSEETPDTEETPLAAAPPPEAKAQAVLFRRGGGSSSSMKMRLKSHEDWLKKNCNALMIAATVIATLAYQSGVNPPSGVWQEDGKDHVAGTSVMADNYLNGYPTYIACNTLSFVAALSVIFLLISGLPLKKRIFMWVLMVAMWVTITFMTFTYLISLWAVSPDNQLDAILDVVGISVLVWLGLIGIVVLAHTIRFLIWCVRKLRKLRKLRNINNPPSSLA